MTRLLFATDFHGSDIVFRKLVTAGRMYTADVIIVGGDITGKAIVPLVQQPDGTHESDFMGTRYVLRNPEELESLKKSVKNAGFYPYAMDSDEFAKLSASQERLAELFSKLMIERVREWIQLMEQHYRKSNAKIYMTGGNDDLFNVEDVLNESDFVVNPEGKVLQLDESHEMISTGYSNMTPWKCPRDVTEEELAKRIDIMAGQVKDMKNCIFNLHAPPYDSTLDYAPELKDLVPVEGGAKFVPVGSVAVRDSITRHQPLLGLHGHIHESRGFCKLGQTLCLNPGSDYNDGVLRAAIVNLDESRVKNYQFTSG